MRPSSEPSPERLIAEQDWVRPLVQRLVRDEASTQDVLQSTWLRALRHPPRAQRGSPGWRGWFARVARNLALRDDERASARHERELRSARGERLPSTHEIAEREELRARIVAHVLALPEPYRSTLVLRYYEGLEPRAIAREQHASGSTVRNRIARGLALLRERLERERGKDWVSCCLAVLPLYSAKLLAEQAGWAGWLVKGGVVAKKIEIATAAAVVVTAGAVWFAWPSKDGSGAPRPKSAAEVALSGEDSGVALPQAGSAQGARLDDAEAAGSARAAAQQRKPADAADPGVAAAGVRVFGHVRDARGEPINSSGGTFRLQMGGATASVELPVLTFDSSGGPPQQVQGMTLELDLLDVQDKTQARVQDLHEVEEPREQLDALDQAVLGKLLNRVVLRSSTLIVFADSEGCQFTANTNMDSSYSVDGLHEGKWHTIATHDGKLCRRQDFEIPSGAHQYLLDLTLDDALQVKVKLRTPDGRELGSAIAADPELSARVALAVVALRPGSAARRMPDGGDPSFGCGTYQPREQLDESRRVVIGEASGLLTIREAPPLEVGLALCGQLIARVPLAPGQDEVEFVLSLEDLRQRFTTVVVRVVDAQTHAPIAGAGVSLDGMRPQVLSMDAEFAAAVLQGLVDRAGEKRAVEADERRATRGHLTDADGIARIPWVVPGLRRIFVSIHSHAPFGGRFEVEPGPIRELPPIELTGHARIRGRVRGAQGEPVQARLQLVPLDRFEETHDDLEGSLWQSSAQGVFEIPNQRRERYVLRLCEGEQGLVPLLVDASEGDVGDLELHLQPPARVSLYLTREPKEGAELRVLTAAGLPVLERDLSGLAPAELALAPGAYLAEVREGAHMSGSVRFVVGKDALRVLLPLD